MGYPVKTGVTAPGPVLRPDFSRGSAPPISPRHHDDYRAELEHGRIGRARADRRAARRAWLSENALLLAYLLGCVSTLLGTIAAGAWR